MGREAAAASERPGGCPSWAVLLCAAPRSVPALPAPRSPPAAPGQEARLAGQTKEARQSQRAGGQTMDSERERPAPALRNPRSRARP